MKVKYYFGIEDLIYHYIGDELDELVVKYNKLNKECHILIDKYYSKYHELFKFTQDQLDKGHLLIDEIMSKELGELSIKDYESKFYDFKKIKEFIPEVVEL